MRRPTFRTALFAVASLLALFAAIHAWSRVRALPELHRRLAAARQQLDLSGDAAHFDAALLATEGKQIILLGESHAIAVNEDLDLALLRYLHRTAGVRIYLSESSYAQGCLFNRYFETGDEELLNAIFAEFRGTPAWTTEHRDFYRRFRAWNLSLPREQRVRIVGVDVEHQPRLAIRFLADLADAAGPAPEAIAATISRLPSLRADDAQAARRFAPDLLASLQQHRAAYQAYLGARYLDFEIVAANLENSNLFYKDHNKPQGESVREQAMYETFRKLYPRFAGERMYGRWGAAHIMQCRVNGREPFAAMLNRPDSPVAGKVAGIQPIYAHSQGVAPTARGYQIYDASASTPFLQIFTPVAEGRVTLFHIEGAAALMTRVLPEYPLARGAQYVVLISDSGPNHPLDATPPAADDGSAPVVVKTVPASGSRDVSPSVTEIRVTFSKDMARGMSWVTQGAASFPEIVRAEFVDPRTNVAQVRLKPDHDYVILMNSGRFQNFRDLAGHPAVPYVLTFHTTR